MVPTMCGLMDCFRRNQVEQWPPPSANTWRLADLLWPKSSWSSSSVLICENKINWSNPNLICCHWILMFFLILSDLRSHLLKILPGPFGQRKVFWSTTTSSAGEGIGVRRLTNNRHSSVLPLMERPCWRNIRQVKQQLERELAPISQYRKRMEVRGGKMMWWSDGETHPFFILFPCQSVVCKLWIVDGEMWGFWEAHMKNNIKKIAGTSVEASESESKKMTPADKNRNTNSHSRALKSPTLSDLDMRKTCLSWKVFHDGQWVPGTAQDFVGRVVKGRKAPFVVSSWQNCWDLRGHLAILSLKRTFWVGESWTGKWTRGEYSHGQGGLFDKFCCRIGTFKHQAKHSQRWRVTTLPGGSTRWGQQGRGKGLHLVQKFCLGIDRLFMIWFYEFHVLCYASLVSLLCYFR